MFKLAWRNVQTLRKCGGVTFHIFQRFAVFGPQVPVQLTLHYSCSITSYVLSDSLYAWVIALTTANSSCVVPYGKPPLVIIASVSLTFAFKYVQTNKTYLPYSTMFARFVCSICHYYHIIIRQTYNNCWKNYPINQLLA